MSLATCDKHHLKTTSIFSPSKKQMIFTKSLEEKKYPVTRLAI